MVYGVATVVGASPREQATGFAWQELDKVRVKGKDQAMAIFCPVALPGQRDQQVGSDLKGVGVGAQGLPPPGLKQLRCAFAQLTAHECEKVPLPALCRACSLQELVAV